jgi:hypothetical protein
MAAGRGRPRMGESSTKLMATLYQDPKLDMERGTDTFDFCT